jgi:carbon-monoxide dehydrogenase small subunit
MAEHHIVLQINEELFELTVQSQTTLLEVLREKIGFTGTKEGCSMGACGACTVIFGDQPILSCLTLAVAAQGRPIRTVEGLSAQGHLSPLQKEFVDRGAVQCGFCTSGMLMSATAALEKKPGLNREEVKQALSGNLCRCTGYVKICDAVVAVSRKARSRQKKSR